MIPSPKDVLGKVLNKPVKKKLTAAKGGFALTIFLLFAAFCIFYFTYGMYALQRAVDKLQSEPVPEGQINLSGLGPAILYILSIVPLICLALPELLFMISFIGNFACKGEKKGFIVLSLIAEIFSLIILGFLAYFYIAATVGDIIVIIVLAAIVLLVLISFIHSIVMLSKYKKAI